MKRNNGITLIALVVTIVILIILAGVAISLTLGDNGIFKKATNAKESYQIAEAKEYVEMKIATLQAEMNGHATLQDVIDYLSDDEEVTYFVSLDKVASIAGQTEIGDANEVYIVYNKFQLKLKKDLKVEYVSKVDVNIEDEIVIKSKTIGYTGQKTAGEGNPYYANVEIEISGDIELNKIEMQDNNGINTALTLNPDKKVTIEVEIGKEYKIIAVTASNRTYTKKIIEKQEEIVTTAQSLVDLKNKVNSGCTYEGKTIKLENDMDLSTVCGAGVGN